MLERVDDISLVVLPDVLNPVVFRTGELLARAIADSHFAQPPQRSDGDPPALALDMGTGSGIGAIFSAKRGYRVVGVDINPEAVRCARINVLLNRVESSVEVRQGDLFTPVSGERFHLVTFNPPYCRGAADRTYGTRWWGTDVMERFAADLPDVLAPDGRALVLLSTQGDEEGMLRALSAQHLDVEPVTRTDLGNEVITVYGVLPVVPRRDRVS